MKINKGDLLKSDVDIITHQVNSQGVMGIGIALSIRKKYPPVYKSYKKIAQSYKDKNKLIGRCLFLSTKGEIITKETKIEKDTKIVANLFGQKNYGKGLQTDYRALEQSMQELRDFAKGNNLSVGIPYRIGCGYAGGNWQRVLKIINETFSDYPVFIYKLDT